MPRSYHQFCAVARALDILGERWTLLIVRELLLGPRRYGELLDALPSMGTNLLAARLSALAEAGVVVKDDAGYALTGRGRDLEATVLALARWGMQELQPPDADDRLRGDWYAVAMLAAHRPAGGRVPAETYAFDIDGTIFHLRAGTPPSARRGPGDAPAFRMTADVTSFLRVATRSAPLSSVTITGDRQAALRWLAAFALPAPVG